MSQALWDDLLSDTCWILLLFDGTEKQAVAQTVLELWNACTQSDACRTDVPPIELRDEHAMSAKLA